MRPEMHPVDSSNIKAVGYDEDLRELYVDFLTSGTYIYSDVPKRVFDGLRAAPSKGSYLHQVVKSSYPYRRL